MPLSQVRYSVYRKVLIREDIVLLVSVVIQYKTNQLSRLAGHPTIMYHSPQFFLLFLDVDGSFFIRYKFYFPILFYVRREKNKETEFFLFVFAQEM